MRGDGLHLTISIPVRADEINMPQPSDAGLGITLVNFYLPVIEVAKFISAVAEVTSRSKYLTLTLARGVAIKDHPYQGRWFVKALQDETCVRKLREQIYSLTQHEASTDWDPCIFIRHAASWETEYREKTWDGLVRVYELNVSVERGTISFPFCLEE